MGTVPRNRPGSQTYDEDNLGFGTIFTDHMLQMSFSAKKGGWQPPQIVPMDNLVSPSGDNDFALWATGL